MKEPDIKKLQTRRIEAEIRKLESEVADTHSRRKRSWVTVLSILAGIITSSIGAYQALIDAGFKNRQLGIEAQVRTHEIFLNQALDRMSGVKVDYKELDDEGNLKLKRRETWGPVTQVGAYASAVALACEFGNLKLPAKQALAFQLKKVPTDSSAKAMLDLLERDCKSKSRRSSGRPKTRPVELYR